MVVIAVDWSKYHVCFRPYGGKLFIGRGETKGGKTKLSAESEDRTEEIVIAVMRKMKARMNDKPDSDHSLSYRVDGLGTLTFIDNGYKAVITPMPRK